MNNWYERAEQQIEEEYNSGHLSSEDYQQAMRELQAELREEAEYASERAYNDVMGDY